MKKNVLSLVAATMLSTYSFDSVAQNGLNAMANQQFQNFGNSEVQPKLVSRTEAVQHLDSVYTYQYNASTQTWDIINRIIDIRYDEHDNIYHEEEQRKTSLGFENMTIREYGFEEVAYSTRIKTRLDQHWNGSGYENSILWTYSYDIENGQLIVRNMQVKDDYDGWVNFEQDVYLYDSNGRLSEDVFSLWYAGNYLINSKKGYTYNSQNQLKKLTYYTFDYQLNNWRSDQRSVYHYDENGNNDRELVQGGEDGGWPNLGKVKRFYDGDNKITDANYFYWSGSDWVKNGVVNYKYNNQGSLKVVTWKSILNGQVNLGTRTRYFYHSGAERLVNEASETISAVSATSPVIVYPNPSAGNFTVKFENKPISNLEIYNSLGEKVLEQRSGEVNLSNMSKGMYFIRVYDDQKIYQEKILVE